MTASLALLIATMLDPKASVAQRNDACFALRGERTPEAVAAFTSGLSDADVRNCAARDLREAGAVDALLNALSSQDAAVQTAAIGELAALRDPRALEALGRAAVSENVMIASTAICALGRYPEDSALPLLLRAAAQPTVAGIAALELAAQTHNPAVLPVARHVLEAGDVAEQVIALGVIADLGDATDLPKLRTLASQSDKVYSRGRGFGFMPPIDVARAAQTAIDRLLARAGKL
jgi:HEAT repeats